MPAHVEHVAAIAERRSVLDAHRWYRYLGRPGSIRREQLAQRLHAPEQALVGGRADLDAARRDLQAIGFLAGQRRIQAQRDAAALARHVQVDAGLRLDGVVQERGDLLRARIGRRLDADLRVQHEAALALFHVLRIRHQRQPGMRERSPGQGYHGQATAQDVSLPHRVASGSSSHTFGSSAPSTHEQ